MHSRAVLRSIKGLFVLIADNTEHCAMQSRGSENIYFYTDIEMDSRVFEQQGIRYEGEKPTRLELVPINRLTMGFMTNPLIGQSSDGMDSLLIVCSGEVFFREIFESCQSNGSVYWGAFIGFLLGGKENFLKGGKLRSLLMNI